MTRRNVFTAISGIIFLIIFFVLLGKFSPKELNTRYSSSSVPKLFNQVNAGLPVKEIYSKLGPPLYLQINPELAGIGAYQQIVSKNTLLEEVEKYSPQSNKLISLVYSEQKWKTFNYNLYFVNVLTGVVVEVGGPIPMD